MGLDIYSYVVVGVKVDPKKLSTKTRVKAFDHDFDYSEDFLFDPKTGKALWEEELQLVSGYDSWTNTFFGYPVVSNTNDWDNPNVEVFIALYVGKTSSHRDGVVPAIFVPPPTDPLAEKSAFMNVLKNAGLIDNYDNYGLWLVQEYNC